MTSKSGANESTDQCERQRETTRQIIHDAAGSECYSYSCNYNHNKNICRPPSSHMLPGLRFEDKLLHECKSSWAGVGESVSDGVEPPPIPTMFLWRSFQHICEPPLSNMLLGRSCLTICHPPLISHVLPGLSFKYDCQPPISNMPPGLRFRDICQSQISNVFLERRFKDICQPSISNLVLGLSFEDKFIHESECSWAGLCESVSDRIVLPNSKHAPGA